MHPPFRLQDIMHIQFFTDSAGLDRLEDLHDKETSQEHQLCDHITSPSVPFLVNSII